MGGLVGILIFESSFIIYIHKVADCSSSASIILAACLCLSPSNRSVLALLFQVSFHNRRMLLHPCIVSIGALCI